MGVSSDLARSVVPPWDVEHALSQGTRSPRVRLWPDIRDSESGNRSQGQRPKIKKDRGPRADLPPPPSLPSPGLAGGGGHGAGSWEG